MRSTVQKAIHRTLLDIAGGMDYLHSVGVLHGDLKASATPLLKALQASACALGPTRKSEWDLLVSPSHRFFSFQLWDRRRKLSLIIHLHALEGRGPTYFCLYFAENTPMTADALQGANVLLKSTATDPRGFTCKLADFGMARVLATNRNHVSTRTYGTVSYMPSELLREGKLTRAVDSYSFGIIMWELFSRTMLHEGLTIAQAGSSWKTIKNLHLEKNNGRQLQFAMWPVSRGARLPPSAVLATNRAQLWRTRALGFELASALTSRGLQVFYKVCYEQLKPPVPDGMPEEYKDLMVRCWDDDPASRPSFS